MEDPNLRPTCDMILNHPFYNDNDLKQYLFNKYYACKKDLLKYENITDKSLLLLCLMVKVKMILLII